MPKSGKEIIKILTKLGWVITGQSSVAKAMEDKLIIHVRPRYK